MEEDGEKNKIEQKAKNTAKQASNKVEQKAKNAMKKGARMLFVHLGKYLIIPMVVVVVVVILWFSIIHAAASAVKDAVKGAFQTIFTNSVKNSDIIVQDTDIDSIIESLKKNGNGITFDSFGLASANSSDNEKQEQYRKYIKKYVEASIATQTIDSNNIDKNNNPDEKVAGCIKLHRVNAKTGETKETIHYTSDLSKYNNSNYADYYSIDESGKVVVLVPSNGGYTEDHIDYKTPTSQYEMPLMFFMDMCLVTQNPNYVQALAQEIIDNTQIVLTLEESVTITTTTVTTNSATGEQLSSSTTQSTTGMINPIVSLADTLLYKTEQTYTTNSNIGQSTTETVNLGVENTTQTTTTQVSSYSFDPAVEKDPIVKYGSDENGNKYKFPEYTQKAYYCPSSNSNKIAYNYLIEGGQLLFKEMDENLENENLEQILKYILYKMSNISFGVTEIDENWFKPAEFSSISLDGLSGDTETVIWFGLRNAGYSEYAVAGVMGNMYVESGLQPGIVNSSSGAYGLCQWLGDRKTKLQAYAASQGKDPSDIIIQIEYLLAELTSDGGGISTSQINMTPSLVNTWKTTNDVSTATTAFYNFFERGGPSQFGSKRIPMAQKYYDEFNGKTYNGGNSQNSTQLLAAIDKVSNYIYSNNYTYRGTYSAYTFPIYNDGVKTLSCSSFVQECLLESGYTQLAGLRKIYARVNQNLGLNDFIKNGISATIITDLKNLQPGDIVQYTTGSHMFFIYAKTTNGYIVKGVPEIMNPSVERLGHGKDGIERSVQFLMTKKSYAIRINN